MDPWLQGLAALFGAQNPGAGPLLDQAGIPPPMGLGGPGTGQDQGIGNWITTVNPEPQTVPGANAGQPNQAQLMQLAAMQGVKPPAPITPIMNGGVTGGVKPPEVQSAALAKQGSPAVNALMQALLTRSAPSSVPSLGALIHGGAR